MLSTRQIKLPPLLPAPAILQNLLCGNNPLSKAFLQDIRQYNAALAFTSLAVKVDEAITNSSGPYCFRVSGKLHHRMGSLLPQKEGKLSYAQLYIHDPAEALSMRNHRNPNLNPEIMSQLQDLMQDVNPYVALYRHAYLIMKDKPREEYPNIEVRLHVGDGTDGRRYNLPTVDELAAIIPGDGSEPVKNDRDIVLHMHDDSLKRISQLHPSYQPLHYVLLFPHGELGWNIHMLLEGSWKKLKQVNVENKKRLLSICIMLTAYRIVQQLNQMHHCIEENGCTINILWMHGPQLNKVISTGFNTIRKLFVQICIREWWMQLLMLMDCKTLASVLSYLHHILAVPVQCISCIRILW